MQTSNYFKPIVIYDNGRVTDYYGSHIAVAIAGYDPVEVLRVCDGKRKRHKGKVFCYLEDLGALGEKIQAEIMKKRGGEKEK